LFLIINVSALDCKEFQENVLWSSNYSYKADTFSNYQWIPKIKCSSEDCFIKDIKTYFRALNFGENDNAIGFMELSNCNKNNPKYAIYQKITTNRDANSAYYWDCGKAQENNICDLDFKDNCFSIKIWNEASVLIDVRKINYTLCQKSLVDNKITGNVIQSGTNYNLKIGLYFSLIVILVFIILKIWKKSGTKKMV